MMSTRRARRLWPLLVALAGAAVILAAAAWAIFEGYASDAEMRPGRGIPVFVIGAVGFVGVLIGVVASIRGAQRPSEPTEDTRRTRRWSLLLVLAGVVIVLAGAAWAIAEGYASDIEMRRGNIVPAAFVGVVGLLCFVIGLGASVRGSQRLPELPE